MGDIFIESRHRLQQCLTTSQSLFSLPRFVYTNMLVELVCPNCKGKLIESPGSRHCPTCHRTYYAHRGILNFLDTDQVFNEGAYEGDQKRAWSKSAQLRVQIHRSKFLSLLNDFRIGFSMSGRRDRIFTSEMRGGSSERIILDVGCGAGRHYFCNYGRVIGVDPVTDLLLDAQELYAEVYQCGGFHLPFADGTFDYVVSSDVIGHIRLQEKDQLFGEMYRVLKKGGRTLHVIETDATNCWFSFAHRYADLFQRYFVDRPGHYGLELPTELSARFKKHGFREIKFQKMSSNIPEIGFLSGCFDNEFKTKSATIRVLTGLDRILAKNLVMREALNFFLEPLARLDDHFTPLDHANGALVVFEK